MRYKLSLKLPRIFIFRYGTVNPKGACLTSLESNGKPSYTLTYGKVTKLKRFKFKV